MLWIILWFVALVVWIASIVIWNEIIFLISLGIVVLLTFPFIYWGLAPRNLFFTFVDEGTAKMVVRGGKFARALIQWEGHTFDKEWNVVEGKERWHPLGGLRFYGIWPIWDIYGYRLRWTSLRENGEPVSHDEILDSVMLKDLVYFAELKGAEERNKIPLNIGLVITLRVVNPYRALFKVQDWLELVLNRIKPLFREFVARHTYSELLEKKQKVGGEVWRELALEEVIQEFERDYGIQIKEGGIEMKDITPPPEHQEAATKKWLAEREREAAVEGIMGILIGMLSRALGLEPEIIQREIRENPELRKMFIQIGNDLVQRKIALDKNALLDIRVSGAKEPKKALLELIAAWQKLLTVAGPKQGSNPKD